MNINNLFKRPSFNFLATQGWIIFLIYLAEQIAILFNTKTTGFIYAISQIYAIIHIIMILPIIQLFSIFTLIFKKNEEANTKKVGLSLLFFFIYISVANLIIECDIETEYRIANVYLIMCILIVIIISIFFILFTLLPCYILHRKEKKNNLIIKKSFLTQNKFILSSTILGVLLYILICILCIVATIVILVK